MNLRRLLVLGPMSLALALLVTSPGHAGLTDALKRKITDKATKKAEEQVDKATDKTEKPAAPTEKTEGEKPEGAPAAASGAGSKVSEVSTKFDFVPGDKVILIDDFTQDELGEFPAHWKLVQGTFEVAEMDGQRWLRCTSDDGHVSMKVNPTVPEFWTLEFDGYGFDSGSYLTVSALDAKGNSVWEASFPHSNKNLFMRCGEISSSTPIEGEVVGRHHVMFMGRGTGLKAYMDRDRVANVPDISAAGVPAEFDFRLWAPGKEVRPMIANVRFAEGCRPAKDMLAEGKLVTYGIRFETGSDVVLPESAPVLRQVASYMEANPTVKLQITGHTDNVGSAPSNLDLSKRRAASVAKVLSDQFGVGADRFSTDGKGDTQAVTSNAKPEGRAMNRRVEFAKL